MKTLQFEGVKVALKQDKTGYVLNLSMHPDDVPEELLRDFVGARYQVVMVRLDGHEEPMDRQREYEGDRAIRIAGLLCRDPKFWQFLHEDNQILEATEKEATDWLRDYLNIPSRSELKTNPQARIMLDTIHKDYNAWTQKN
jgi:hypothetical protein